MKNIKIGMKLVLGFGVVVAMIIVITLTVVISSTNTLDNVDTMAQDSTLQIETNELMANFYEARIYANILYTVISDESYESFSRCIAECEAKLSDIYDQISQNPILEKFRPQYEAFEESMRTWHAGVNNVQADNNHLTEIMSNSAETGSMLNDVKAKPFLEQLALLNASSSAELPNSNANTAQIELAEKISSDISIIRMNCRIILDTFDTSEFDSIMTMIDNVIEDVNEYESLVAQQAHKDTAQNIKGALTSYRAYMTEFVESIEKATVTIANTKPIGIAALGNLSSVLEAVDEAVTHRVGNVNSSVSSSLILSVAISALSVIVAVVLAIVITSGISKPLVNISGFLDKVRTTGNMIIEPENAKVIEKYSNGKDEICRCINSCSSLISRLLEIDEKLNCVADGDLTVDMKVLSEEDSLGLAITKMLESLNRMFIEINNSSMQVATGAGQVATGAQDLAQGSAEQASTVEELSASISEVTVRTKDNADLATRSATLANTIMQNAESGSRQMESMMQAVKEINEASHDINKVIKVIDDIAFQTNILALNAAVEAARAGQHGKGFAVVAEEVRSLAAKSAEAAKDTGVLIANSMEKAELGARIAEQTAASLAEIVSGINESSKIADSIAKSSDDQTAVISQIDIGINQVSQVVQQNSATAQESAAASEEMSSQTNMLREMVAQFKLKDAGSVNQMAVITPLDGECLEITRAS